MKSRIFIDGQEGTTGLEIHERLRGRADLELLEIGADSRKDPAVTEALIASDAAPRPELPVETAEEPELLTAQAEEMRTEEEGGKGTGGFG